MAKNIRGFLENLFEYYFLNIIVNVNFFSDLKFKYYCEYYQKLLGHKIFRSMVSWASKFLFEKFLKPFGLLHT